MSYIIYAVGEYPLLEQDIIYSWIQNVYRLDRLPVLVVILVYKVNGAYKCSICTSFEGFVRATVQ